MRTWHVNIKPRISRFRGKWVCWASIGFGLGSTRRQAFLDWEQSIRQGYYDKDKVLSVLPPEKIATSLWSSNPPADNAYDRGHAKGKRDRRHGRSPQCSLKPGGEYGVSHDAGYRDGWIAYLSPDRFAVPVV